MDFLVALALAALTQDAPSRSAVPTEPAAAHAEDIRCGGVFYAAQQALRQNDPRQRGIQASLLVVTARIDARVAAGEVDEAAVLGDMQAAVNAGSANHGEALADCLAIYAPVGAEAAPAQP